MKKYFWPILIIVFVVIVGVYINQRSNSQTSGFNLGLISILSGDYAVVGENVKNGVILASEMYNQTHPNAKINLIIEDDGYSGGKGVNAYQKLINIDKVTALINVSTPTIDGIYNSVSKTNLPVIQVGEQGIDPTDDNIFGIFPSNVASEYDYGLYLKNKGVTEISLVYTNVDAMIRFVQSFKRGFQGKTTDYVINADEKDFRTHALKVAVTQPVTIGLFITPQQGAQFIKEFMKVRKNSPQFFFDANFQSGYSDYERILGDLKILDGTLVGTVDSTITDAFKKAYKDRFGIEAGFLSDMGYDGFNLLISTYSKDQREWIQNIKNTTYDGVGGNIQFDTNGNRKPKTKIMVISEGKMIDIAQ